MHDLADNYTVFVSYSHKDWAVAGMLSYLIHGLGAACQLDRRFMEAGDNTVDKIEESISRSHEFTMICSPNYVSSEWLYTEHGMARSYKCRIVPLRLYLTVPEFEKIATFRGLTSLSLDDFDSYLNQLQGRIEKFRRGDSSWQDPQKTIDEVVRRARGKNDE